MKILNVITDSNIGGAGIVLINYLRYANRGGAEHCVVMPRDSLLKPRIDALGVRVVELDGIAERSFSIAAISAFSRLLSEERPDVVHTHGCLSARLAAKLLRPFSRRAPYIVFTRHCIGERGMKLSGAINNALADRIIAISDAARDELLAMGVKPGKIETMYNGSPPLTALSESEKRSVRAAHKLEGFTVAIVGRLEPVKGHAYVLESAAQLPHVRFLIAGTGSLEDQLRSSAPPNCVFTGFISDVAHVLSVCDVQLNASTYSETSSLSIIEGYSLGVPAIATDVGGNPSIVLDGESGLIVPPYDSTAIADAIRTLERDRALLRRMSDRALELYRSRFTAEAMASRIDSVYKEIMTR
ncbi:MAG: glycosyltransferase [Oscillospiraceae bacterium]|jgi:glycosyltransferase involved in cell wall biosynthesis|nr:glycosyltransferase [Oscillospiraceae bacterium]